MSAYDIIAHASVQWAVDRWKRGIFTEINGDAITVWRAGGRS